MAVSLVSMMSVVSSGLMWKAIVTFQGNHSIIPALICFGSLHLPFVVGLSRQQRACHFIPRPWQ